jgi:hypothetical protein
VPSCDTNLSKKQLEQQCRQRVAVEEGAQQPNKQKKEAESQLVVTGKQNKSPGQSPWAWQVDNDDDDGDGDCDDG